MRHPNRDRDYREPDAEELDALQRFANAHGRLWKQELSNVYWYNARLWRDYGRPNDEVGAILHGIRNDFGPTWLYDICKVKPEKKGGL